ncbi:Sel1 repeat [Nesidiocoris tenuis]|uniref:Sel1 repeat n=1 Tax=Nesidiocoris tenuis TaxID=355587 RepID=A0ABN7AKN5_9HEMI|nr:Sel1 repeat [Nesidiocoris tenuis]
MWKCLSRGVREAFERNLNFGRPSEVSRVQKEKPHATNYCKRLAPYVNDKRKQFGSSRNEDGSQKQGESSTHWFRDSWFGAFSCSGALAVGWILTQPCIWRKWCGLRDRNHGHELRFQILNLLPSTAWTQPISLGPHNALNVNNEISQGPIFGPRTAEEALDEAAEEFRHVHNTILAEIENKRAVDLINRKKSREALELFISASHRGYGPAAYNMAQCYELGIGIKQNFHEAAKWYQKAVDLGHLTSMYNLGVFYAHGWGGLSPDNKKARQLFIEAAQLGQPDAKAALGYQSDPHPTVPGDGTQSSIPSPLTSVEPTKENYSEDNMEDFSPNLTQVSNNADEIFKLASSFESSTDPDPVTSQLTLELYRIASDMGHLEAKTRVQVLQMLAAFGIGAETPKAMPAMDDGSSLTGGHSISFSY